jgi:sn-1 stearoyl-lipid 9-desaturase
MLFAVQESPLVKLFRRDRTFTQPVNPVIFFFLAILHVGAIAALFFFSWKAVALSILLWWVVGSLGIGMGYHRLLTHRGYKTPKWIEYFLTICASLVLQGGPIGWVATHRIHHQRSDKEGDPHSPHDGGFWAHVGWIITGDANHNRSVELLPYVPELRKDRFHKWISEWHWVPLATLAVVLLVLGGWPYVLWCICFRTVFGLHATYMVNSGTHMWGSRRFVTSDNSTNNFWIAMLTFGEGWHNNHHAHPVSARHGLAWYEIDMNWYGIRVLQALGLAWDVKLPRLSPELRVPTVVSPAVPAEQELLELAAPASR